jgi:uncharacterized membrane protein
MRGESMRNREASRRLLEALNAQRQHLRDTVRQTRALVRESRDLLDQPVYSLLPRGEPDPE